MNPEPHPSQAVPLRAAVGSATPGSDGSAPAGGFDRDGARAALQIRGLTKSFSGTTVLHDINLTVRPGEIHALVGQNGSGKSTLVKVLSGVYSADRGTIIVGDGHELSNPPSPAELRLRGLAFVHQDLGLVGEMSVAENICVGQYDPRSFTRVIEWGRERAAVRESLTRLGVDLAPDRLTGTLHPGEKVLVAIARGIHKGTPGSGVIVFDESTQSLPRNLLPDFYKTVREIAATGTAVIFISHQLGEVLTLADRVSALQDGRLVAEGRSCASLSESQLAALVLGRELDPDVIKRSAGLPRRHSHGGGLKATAISTDVLGAVDMHVVPGEILGVTGQSGAGHEDLPYALSGARPATGEVVVDGSTFGLGSVGPRELQRAGVVLVPQERAQAGLALSLTAQENLTLPRATHRGHLLLNGWQEREYREATERLNIVPRRPGLPVANFSGGNQQKLLLAKWLLNNPRVLLLHEPTQAVDVGARIEILRVIRAVADSGVAVLISSIETQDLALVSDRVVVFTDGQARIELIEPDSAAAIEDAVFPDIHATNSSSHPASLT